MAPCATGLALALALACDVIQLGPFDMKEMIASLADKKTNPVVLVGRGTLILLAVLQIVIAPFGEEIQWQILIVTMPPTLLALYCFGKLKIVTNVLLVLSGVVLIELAIAITPFIAIAFVCQYVLYFQSKSVSRGENV